MKEILIVENFAGISKLEIRLNKINVLIGPQATGKSICAKLLFFFKKFDTEIINAVENATTKKEFDMLLINKFIEYFPIHSYPKQNFLVRYEINEQFIEIKGNNGNRIELDYSEEYSRTLTSFKRQYKKIKTIRTEQKTIELNKSPIEIKEQYFSWLKEKIGEYAGFNQLFIPAGRSFFANLQKSIFSFLSSNKSIDPFIIEFGSFYEIIKEIEQRASSKERSNSISDIYLENILSGKYLHEKGNDFLVHPDGRKINIAYSSSGQQETLPLVLILKALPNVKMLSNGASIYIEEPEAHIFPNAQKLIVEFISYVFNSSLLNYQFFITTHSPYILTSFNNLIQAGVIESESNDDKRRELYRIIDKNLILKPNSISAFSLHNDGFCDLIDSETGLIKVNSIDSVSNDISVEFDNLLNLL